MVKGGFGLHYMGTVMFSFLTKSQSNRDLGGGGDSRVSSGWWGRLQGDQWMVGETPG